jgi:hypothetical protein
MRQGQQNNKRMRNRNNRKGPNPLTRSYESNGGDVKIRGTALHVAEKYVQLARDAQSSGDRVAGENYLQHAEHYFRIVAAAQAQMPQQPPQAFRNDDGEGDDEDEFGNGQGGGYSGNSNYGGNPYAGGQNAYGGGNNNGNSNSNGGNRDGGNNGGNGYQGNQANRNGGQQPNHQGGHAGGQQPSYSAPDQLPAFINGGNGGGNAVPQEQPSLETAQAPQGQPGGSGPNERGGNFRRRRRPFREPYSGGERAPVAAAEGDEGPAEE